MEASRRWLEDTESEYQTSHTARQPGYQNELTDLTPSGRHTSQPTTSSTVTCTSRPLAFEHCINSPSTTRQTQRTATALSSTLRRPTCWVTWTCSLATFRKRRLGTGRSRTASMWCGSADEHELQFQWGERSGSVSWTALLPPILSVMLILNF